MKAVTNGYAIASRRAAPRLVLFGSYVEELRAHLGDAYSFDFSLNDPKVIIGLFSSAVFSLTFHRLQHGCGGKAAGAPSSAKCGRQLTPSRDLRGEDKADYGVCVDIVTKAALREMIIRRCCHSCLSSPSHD